MVSQGKPARPERCSNASSKFIMNPVLEITSVTMVRVSLQRDSGTEAEVFPGTVNLCNALNASVLGMDPYSRKI